MSYESSDVSAGQDATAAQQNALRADLLKILSATGRVWLQDGWQDIPNTDTFTFVSNTANVGVVTVAGDQTGTYRDGDKIKLTQSTGGVKYFVIRTSVYTTLTTITFYGTSVYTLENEAISSVFISRATNPVGFPNIKSFVYAYRDDASYQSMPTATTTQITNNAELADSLGEYDTSAYRFTAKHEGWYRVSGQFQIDNIGSGKRAESIIRLNTATTVVEGISYSSVNAADVSVPLPTTFRYMNVGDYLALYGYHNNGSSELVLKQPYQTFMIVERILPWEF